MKRMEIIISKSIIFIFFHITVLAHERNVPTSCEIITKVLFLGEIIQQFLKFYFYMKLYTPRNLKKKIT